MARQPKTDSAFDDASGFLVGWRFVSSETTWNHFCHFRSAFETHGLPEAVYTDALSLFGLSSTHDDQDPKSQFQRAFKGLGVAHLVAPTPQAKGKIERRFLTFQNRLIPLLAHEKVVSYQPADEILQMEIQRQNNAVLRLTGRMSAPAQVWREQLDDRRLHLKPAPDSFLLDQHLSLRCSRRVNADSTIDFECASYEISPTGCKRVPLLFWFGISFSALLPAKTLSGFVLLLKSSFVLLPTPFFLRVVFFGGMG